MKKTESTRKAPRMSDAAVQAKTGKTWPEWFTILDAAGAGKMNHRQIVAYLSERHKLPSWWCQMVSVGYEQGRGMRQKHQKPAGYEISVSRTLAASAASVYQAWQDEKTRRRWLPKTAIVIRKATPARSMRITWANGASSLSVNLYPKGNSRSQVVVQHGKLRDAKAAARMKDYWAATLDRLKETLEA